MQKAHRGARPANAHLRSERIYVLSDLKEIKNFVREAAIYLMYHDRFMRDEKYPFRARMAVLLSRLNAMWKPNPYRGQPTMPCHLQTNKENVAGICPIFLMSNIIRVMMASLVTTTKSSCYDFVTVVQDKFIGENYDTYRVIVEKACPQDTIYRTICCKYTHGPEHTMLYNDLVKPNIGDLIAIFVNNTIRMDIDSYFPMVMARARKQHELAEFYQNMDAYVKKTQEHIHSRIDPMSSAGRYSHVIHLFCRNFMTNAFVIAKRIADRNASKRPSSREMRLSYDTVSRRPPLYIKRTIFPEPAADELRRIDVPDDIMARIRAELAAVGTKKELFKEAHFENIDNTYGLYLAYYRGLKAHEKHSQALLRFLEQQQSSHVVR